MNKKEKEKPRGIIILKELKDNDIKMLNFLSENGQLTEASRVSDYTHRQLQYLRSGKVKKTDPVKFAQVIKFAAKVEKKLKQLQAA